MRSPEGDLAGSSYAHRVVALHRFPVKSLAGERVSELAFGPAGTVVGDRIWAVQDAYSGLVLSAKHEPRLLFVRAATRGEEVAVHVPGVDAAVSVDSSAAVLSAWLGRQVRPVNLADARPELHFDFGYPTEHGLGSFGDNGGFTHVVTTGTVTEFAASCTRSGVAQSESAALRRLRPNVVVEAGAHAEDGWRGALVGSRARLTVMEPTIRCSVVEHPQPGLSPVPGVLDLTVRERAGAVGCYATARPGDLLRTHDRLEQDA